MKSKKINLKKEKLAKLNNPNSISGGNLNSENPLTPPTCLQTSAVYVTEYCNNG